MHTLTSPLGACLLACSIAFGAGAHAQLVEQPPTLLPTLSDVPARVVACSKIVGNELRLKCFDELTNVVSEITRAASARSQFAWSVQDAGTGNERKVTIAIASSEAIVGTDTISKKNAFFLVAACSNRQLTIYVAFPEKAYDAPMNVITRRDNQKINTMFYPSESKRAMGLWNDGLASELISNLSKINSIGFEFQDTRMPVILNFDVRGATEALKSIQSACPR